MDTTTQSVAVVNGLAVLRGRLLARSTYSELDRRLRKELLELLRAQEPWACRIVNAWLDAGPEALLSVQDQTADGAGDVVLWPDRAARSGRDHDRALRRWHLMHPRTLEALEPVLD